MDLRFWMLEDRFASIYLEFGGGFRMELKACEFGEDDNGETSWSVFQLKLRMD